MSNTSVSTTFLADTLPLTVSKLDSLGLNWMIFLIHFKNAVDAKEYWGHFDGSIPQPTSILSAPAVAATTTATATTAPQTVVNQEEIDKWNKNKCSAKSLLIQKLPDLASMKVHSKTLVQE